MPVIHPYLLYFLAFAIPCLVSAYAVSKILFIARKKKLFDLPDETRKIHGAGIPSLGGTGIFAGYLAVAAFFMNQCPPGWNYILAASAILFFTGVYDDIMNMRPSKKLLAQLVASFIAVWLADVRITSLYGIADVGPIPYWLGVALTTLCCTFFINVFNFVDGIDGLACMVGILYTVVPGLLFATADAPGMAGICFGLAGACVGLFFYNRAPARIYMGDTGSMFLGFVIFVLVVTYLERYGNQTTPIVTHSGGAANIAAGLLLLPVFDAIRVFILRISRGISPLRADRTHLHYYLLDAGLSHTKAVALIVGANIVFVVSAWAMQGASILRLLAQMGLMLGYLFVILRRRRGVPKGGK